MQRVSSFREEGGKLYVCATPIGNLQDMTDRLRATLATADIIAAEDTRMTRKLLSRLQVDGGKLVSYHEHSDEQREDQLIRALLEGQRVALVSDAGTPAVSDPGSGIIAKAVASGIPVVPVPGPTAAVAALVASGLPTERFTFVGFLPREKRDRDAAIRELSRRVETLLFYEAPHRLRATLQALAHGLGCGRRIVLGRELTKLHEEFLRGTLQEAVELYAHEPPRGEYVLVVEGADPTSIESDGSAHRADPSLDTDEDIRQRVLALTEEGVPKKEAMRQVARLLGVSRRDIYQILQLESGPDEQP